MKFWRKSPTVCFVAAALMLLCFIGAGAFFSQDASVFSSVSWQWTGWRSSRLHTYDPCLTPEGRPSGAKVYVVGPITFTTLRFRLPTGSSDPLLTESASSPELDANEPVSSKADEDLFPLVPSSEGDVPPGR